MLIEKVALVGGAVAAWLVLVACGSSNDSNNPRTDPDAGGNDAGQTADAGDGGGDGSPGVYAFVVQDWSTGSGSTYVDITRSLDVTSLPHMGREFAGPATATSIGGKLFVAGEAPRVTRFSPQDATPWTAEGELNFATHGASYVDFIGNITVGPQKAYLVTNTVDRIVWDPSAMTVRTKVTGDARVKPTRDGFSAAYGTEHVEDTQRVLQPYYWALSGSNDTFAPYSQVVVYDKDTDQTRAVLDVNVPDLNHSSKDAAGNMYFSSGTASATAWLFDSNAPRTGMVRIRAGEESVDATFAFRFEDVTAGRAGAAFHAVGEGKGFMAVFHNERLQGGTGGTPSEVNSSKNWHLWKVDLQAKTASELPGIDYFNGYYIPIDIDSRHFVLVPNDKFSSTTVYEVLPDFSTQKRFETPGFLLGAFRVR